MAKLKFEVLEHPDRNTGLLTKFTDGKRQTSSHYYTSPSLRLGTALLADDYIKSKYPNVKTKHHCQFIREQLALQLPNHTTRLVTT